MKSPTISRTSVTPMDVPRTVRNLPVKLLNSLPAGRMVPLAAIGLLREDSAIFRLSMAFNLMETADMLINEVNLSVRAYLVPHLAFDRFQSMDDLNRSWEGKPPRPNLPVIPFFEERTVPSNEATVNVIHRHLGEHFTVGSKQHTGFIEAYNQIYNYRARNRSKNLPLRTRLQMDLAPAFWDHSQFAHIVPDFDQATMDGNVALNVVAGKMPVQGIYLNDGQQKPVTGGGLTKGQNGVNANAGATGYHIADSQAALSEGRSRLFIKADAGGFPDVFAELQQNGITVSLANLDLAKKTQAFAKLKEKYKGHSEDYIVDLLFNGVGVPEQAWQEPILLAEQKTIFGMAQRYATNGSDLTKSVVNGSTMINMNIRAPQCNPGGVIMVVAEILPGQLFERSRNPYLHVLKPDDCPQFVRDFLDPEPVEPVRNGDIDTDHATPNGVFGYQPMNAWWQHMAPKIGGRFYRPKVDSGYNQDRERLWAVEQVSPTLSQDFYVSRNIHSKPFSNPNQDVGEVTGNGICAITGLTQFGPMLVEASNNYSEVLAEAPQARIVK